MLFTSRVQAKVLEAGGKVARLGELFLCCKVPSWAGSLTYTLRFIIVRGIVCWKSNLNTAFRSRRHACLPLRSHRVVHVCLCVGLRGRGAGVLSFARREVAVDLRWLGIECSLD